MSNEEALRGQRSIDRRVSICWFQEAAESSGGQRCSSSGLVLHVHVWQTISWSLTLTVWVRKGSKLLNGFQRKCRNPAEKRFQLVMTSQPVSSSLDFNIFLLLHPSFPSWTRDQRVRQTSTHVYRLKHEVSHGCIKLRRLPSAGQTAELHFIISLSYFFLLFFVFGEKSCVKVIMFFTKTCSTSWQSGTVVVRWWSGPLWTINWLTV